MGAAFFPVVSGEYTEMKDLMIDGKAICRASPVLDNAAKKLGVKPLTSFYGSDVNDVIEEYGLDVDETFEDTTKWFSADEGLKTVRALLTLIKENPDSIAWDDILTWKDGVVWDLEGLEQILILAQKHNAEWFLACDF
jgi:hypothetical protein